MGKSPSPRPRPASPASAKHTVVVATVALAAGLACSSTALWDDDHTIYSNVLGKDPGSLAFWPRGMKTYAEAMGLPFCNLSMLGYCIFIAQKVKVNLPSARWLESGLATLLTAFGGGTIVPLLLGKPVVWLRANDLFLYHVTLAWILVNASPLEHYVRELLRAPAAGAALNLLFQSFRAAVVFALMAMAKKAEVPGGVGTAGLLVCGTLGGCGGIFLPLSKGLEPVRNGAPVLMETAFTATAAYLAADALLQTEFGQSAVAGLPGDDMSCVGQTKLAQLGQFLTMVYFAAVSLM
jgi:uncharacterized membrane protein YeiH